MGERMALQFRNNINQFALTACNCKEKTIVEIFLQGIQISKVDEVYEEVDDSSDDINSVISKNARTNV